MNPALVPVCLVQGVLVARRTIKLPPATGPTTGVVTCPGIDTTLRLAVVGESTAAGMPAVTWVATELTPDSGADLFARDGFHPAPAGYRLWARTVCDSLG